MDLDARFFPEQLRLGLVRAGSRPAPRGAAEAESTMWTARMRAKAAPVRTSGGLARLTTSSTTELDAARPLAKGILTSTDADTLDRLRPPPANGRRRSSTPESAARLGRRTRPRSAPRGTRSHPPHLSKRASRWLSKRLEKAPPAAGDRTRRQLWVLSSIVATKYRLIRAAFVAAALAVVAFATSAALA